MIAEQDVTVRGRRFRRIIAMLLVLVAVGLAACGDDDEEGGNGDAATAPATAQDGKALIDSAKQVVEAAKTGQVYSDEYLPTSLEQVEPYGEWRGPDSAPAVEKGKNVQAILCTRQAQACVDAGNGIAEAGKVLGWTVQIIDGGGTAEGYARAMNTALGRNPDAIIGVAVPGAAIGDQLERAKDAGVLTVGLSDEPGSGFDSYVQLSEPLMHATLAAQDIARTEGKSKTIVVNDPGIRGISAASDAYKKVMEACSGCETTTVDVTIANASDPTKVAPVIRGALAEMPDATTLLLPYSIPLAAVADTLRQVGKQEQVAVLVKDVDPVSLQGIADGDAYAASGTSLGWLGWASADQVVRGLAGEPYLESAATGTGVGLYTEDNLPPGNNVERANTGIDYKAEYERIWSGDEG